MFDDEKNESLFQPITEEELLGVLRALKKDKCPGPDGWTIEFFTHFFDIIKKDLLRMVEASRISGNIHQITTSTQIALIPKKARAESFQDFRLISLCNITFKIITKIIAERIKVTLASFLSKDQHAFLRGRNILDAIANTQESLFSMISKKSDAAILKIDLQRAYDCLDWGFIRCLLAKISLKSNSISWIMSCVENVNYAVIINGMPSPFFPAERGLRQGCPLSPLLFILAMNSLSLHINKVLSENRCRPVKICRDNFISHNLFFDDVFIFAMLCRVSWICLNDILNRFQRATGLQINKAKSTLFHNDINMEMVKWISELLGIEMKSLKDGLKYLGFQLKAKGYSKADWQWLIDRYYKKISAWEYKILSLAGRIILTQVVLSQLVVYWAHIFFLPASIIHKMSRISANFIWGGKSNQRKFHLSKMENISLPKNLSGWGLLDLRNFGKALLCKSLWRGIFGEGPWSITIKKKYMKGKDLEFCRILIGIDPILSGWECITIPECLLFFFYKKGIFTWDKLISVWHGPIPLWKEANDLHLSEPLVMVWNSVKDDALRSCGFHRSGTGDHLIWIVPNAKLSARVKGIYSDMINLKASRSCSIYPTILWKSGFPLKMIIFSWLVFHNKNLTWENLRKRNWHEPSRCSMCESAEESNYHMFFQFKSSLLIWYELALLYGFSHVVFVSIHAAFEWWSAQRESWRSFIIIVLWCAWKWRNNNTFKDSKDSLKSILQHFISIYDSVPIKQHKMKKGHMKEKECPLNRIPSAFFDGAKQHNIYGYEVHIIMDEKLQYLISWNGGKGTNSLAEARALAGLLALCVFFDIQEISIYGDSKTMIDHYHRCLPH
eukprot:PITA_01784